MMASPLLLVTFALTLLLGGFVQPAAPGSPCQPWAEVSAEDAEQAQAVVQEFVAAVSDAAAPGADANTIATTEATLARLMTSYVLAPPGSPTYIEDLGYLELPLPTDADVPLSVGEPLELYDPAPAPILLLTVEVSNGPETGTFQFVLVNENGQWQIDSVAPVTLDPAGCYRFELEPPDSVVGGPPVGIEPAVVVGSPPIVVTGAGVPACSGEPLPGSSGEMPPVVVTSGEIIPVEEMAPPGLHVANADGTGLTSHTPNAASPAWSPNGDKIAFIRFGDPDFGAGNNVAVVDADGSSPTDLTSSQDFVWEETPAWSPDSTRVAFIRQSGDSSSELFVMAADGSALTKLADVGGLGPPSWSPDGTRIAYVGPGGMGSNIWVIGADGSGQERLTDLSGEISDPTWSPDGAHIAFAAMVFDDNGESTRSLYVMNGDGTGLKALTKWDPLSAMCEPVESQPAATPTPDSTAIFGAPSWSPDGTRLAFGSNVGVAMIDVDGSDLTVLPVDGVGVQEAVWSPEGTRIAFSGAVGGNPDEADSWPSIFVVRTDGSGLTRVADLAAGWEGTIAWAPDGSKFAFAAGPQGV